MVISNQTLTLPEGTFNVEVLQINQNDRQNLFSIYNQWRNLSNELISINGRGVNLPEALSESTFCLEMDCVRVISSISGANSSWDCYDLNRHKRIQVKACSVLPDLTSFGPTSEWDEIYFMDFCKDGSWRGEFDIYLIDNDLIYNHRVNNNQTMREQQLQKRRPRFSIYRDIIQKQKIKPVFSGSLEI
jgi:hypothetical protein